EAVFKKVIKDEGFEDKIEVDSAGTIGYHTGEPSDKRMQKHAIKRGYKLDHLAKQFNPVKDFEEFDYIITMDDENYSDVVSFDPEGKFRNKIFRMSNFAGSIKFNEVPDPYYKGPEGFEEVLDLLEDSCKVLLEKIKNDIENL
ncbi:MAG: low molecular weight phosphotyrosine protein phosphatase, partial [Ignavibacteriales bacterium]